MLHLNQRPHLSLPSPQSLYCTAYILRLTWPRLCSYLSLAVLLLFASVVWSRAEIIYPSRRVDWVGAGYRGSIPAPSNIVNVRNYGAKADGITDDYAAITVAISSSPAPGVILLPEGTYKIKSTIKLTDGKILRGAGVGKTHLAFDLGGVAADCIQIIRYQRGTFTPVVSGLSKGSTSLVIGDGKLFKSGDTAEIQQENDPKVMYTKPEWNQPWAQDAVGQFFKVLSVNGNTLTIDRPLNIGFRQELNPQVRPNGLIKNAGIEDLHLRRLDLGIGHTILIKNAENCWVRRVESELTCSSHVYVESSMNIEVKDCYFHHAHGYGGGQGYGVNCVGHTTDCLIENNIFNHLRHSMLAQAGANGNVYAYNYSRDPAAAEDSGTWTPPDISIHGHYPFMNLFEGNIVQLVSFADYWGPAGPGNTLFRNRIESGNIAVMDHSHSQNIVGNELVAASSSIRIEAGVNGTLVHGNSQDGKITWAPSISDHVLPNSYYLSNKPSFFGSMEWPPFGGNEHRSLWTIPAKIRFDSGSMVPPPPLNPPKNVRIISR